MSSEVKVKVSLVTGAVATGLAKVKSQFSKLRNDLSHELGTFLAFGGILAGFEAMIDKASKIANISKRFATPPKELQRVANAAKDVVEMEDVARVWNKIAVNQQKAIAGNEEMRKSFADLGIPMDEVVKLPIDQLFYRIADATATTTDRSKAYAAVVALGGRNAGILYSTLEKGSGKIKAQGDEMGVMADSTVEKLHAVHVSVERLKQTLFIYGGSIVSFFAKVAESIGALVGTIVNRFEIAGKAAMMTGSMLKALMTGKIAEFDWEGYKQGIKSLAAEVKREGEGVHKQFQELWNPKTEDHGNDKPVDRDLEPTKGEAAAVEHIADLKAKLAELERKAANDELDAQSKINALIAQRATLLKEAAGEKDEEKKLGLQIDAAHVNAEIIAAQKASAKELESAQDRLDKAKRDRAYDGLKTDDDRREFLLKEIAKIEKLIGAEKDPAEKVKLQTDREDDLKKLQDLQSDKAPTIAANSLRRIGGQQAGGFSVSGIDDKLLREQTRHGKLLEEIAKNTAGKSQELIMQ